MKQSSKPEMPYVQNPGCHYCVPLASRYLFRTAHVENNSQLAQCPDLAFTSGPGSFTHGMATSRHCGRKVGPVPAPKKLGGAINVAPPSSLGVSCCFTSPCRQWS